MVSATDVAIYLYRKLLITSLLAATLIVNFNLTAESPLPVVFYSKMPTNWLGDAANATEPVSYQTLRLLLQHNTALIPRFVQVSHSRAEILTKEDLSGCLSGILDLPHRRDQYAFSLPFTAVQGIRLYMKADNPHVKNLLLQKNTDSTISLLSILLYNRALLIGVDKDRSYGQTLDNILQDPAMKRNTVFRHSGAKIGELWRMLEEGRVDAILEYPFLVADKLSADTLSLQLTEVPAIETAYITCNKASRGQAIIQSLNRTIQAMRFQPDYINVHLAVVAPEQHNDYLIQYRNAMQAEDHQHSTDVSSFK